MPIDIASLHIVTTVSMVTMAVALPAVMGRVNAAARRAQVGVILQAAGWMMLLLSGTVEPGSATDRALSTISMFGIAAGLAQLATAFDLWCGRAAHDRMPALIAIVMPLGYAFGFSDYKKSLSGTYPTREYCVQYRETAFDFVSRLMEEEGIYYFFEYEDGKHTLVMADAPGNYFDCDPHNQPEYRPGRLALCGFAPSCWPAAI